MDHPVSENSAAFRAKLFQRVFPKGVPRVWCPPLTHYDSQGAIDAKRIAAHWRFLAPHLGGVLIPGSTGDGWELNKDERRQLLEIGLRQACQLDLHVLVGTLHPDANETLALIREDIRWLKDRIDEHDAAALLEKAHVCGFTVCAPRGKDLTQEQIGRALDSVLELGLPTAIYQLPQVTLNEIGPELAANLASRYGNFVFLKDTSGSDTIMLSGRDLQGVFTARGAEGDYARWLKTNAGPYDGFLLASANCFARELLAMTKAIQAGRPEMAELLSKRVTDCVQGVFQLAASLREGNPFANGNKAIDHFMAYGPKALAKPGPRLHAGTSLPFDLLSGTGDILIREQLMPAKGYLE